MPFFWAIQVAFEVHTWQTLRYYLTAKRPSGHTDRIHWTPERCTSVVRVVQINPLGGTGFASCGYRGIEISREIVAQMNLPGLVLPFQLSKEFTTVGIRLETSGHIINSIILDTVNPKWTTSEKSKTACEIWSNLNRKCTVDLLKLQTGALSKLVGVLTGYYIIGNHAYLKKKLLKWGLSTSIMSEKKEVLRYLLLRRSPWAVWYWYGLHEAFQWGSQWA